MHKHKNHTQSHFMAHKPQHKIYLDPPHYLHFNSLCRIKACLPLLKNSVTSPTATKIPTSPQAISIKPFHSPRASLHLSETISCPKIPDLSRIGNPSFARRLFRTLITQEPSPSSSGAEKQTPKSIPTISIDASPINKIIPLSKFSRLNDSSSLNNSSNVGYDDDEFLSEPAETIFDLDDRTHDLKNYFNITLKTRKNIIKSNPHEVQRYPLLVKIEAQQPPFFKKAPVDIVCVIDRSGSMDGEKLAYVKKALNAIIDLLDDNDRLSIISFSDFANRVTNLQCMSAENKEKTRKSLKRMRAEGLTNIADGMEHALKILKSRRTINQIAGVFLLSDGLDKQALNLVKDSIKKFDIQESYSIHTFGFGNDHDSDLMTQISDLKQGNFYYIDDMKFVDQAFLNCLGSLAYSFANDGELTVTPLHPSVLDESIQISRPLGDPALWTKNEDSYTAKLGHIISNKTRNFVLKIKIPKNEKEIKTHRERVLDIIKVSFTFKDLKGNPYQINKVLSIHLLNPSEPTPQFKDDRDVLVQYYRVKGYEILSQAKKLADNLEYSKAMDLVRNFRLDLELCIVRKNPVVQGVIQDLVKTMYDVSPKNYNFFGKHNMISRARAQGQEKYSFQSSVKYSTPGQESYQERANSLQFVI